jgi:hypothetical protein
MKLTDRLTWTDDDVYFVFKAKRDPKPIVPPDDKKEDE